MQPRSRRIHSDSLYTVTHESGEVLLKLTSRRAGGKPARPQHRYDCRDLFLANGGTEARYAGRRGARPSRQRFRCGSRTVLLARRIQWALWGTMKILHGLV